MNRIGRSLLRNLVVEGNRGLRRFESTVNTKLDQPDDRPQFPGSRSEWTTKLEFNNPNHLPGIPVYRVTSLNRFSTDFYFVKFRCCSQSCLCSRSSPGHGSYRHRPKIRSRPEPKQRDDHQNLQRNDSVEHNGSSSVW